MDGGCGSVTGERAGVPKDRIFSTEMGDGSQRSLSEPRLVVVSDQCREEMETRARREMELGGNIGQGRQLAINVCLRPKACQAVSRTNTMSQIIAMRSPNNSTGWHA